MFYYTSDIHFGHNNVIKYNARPFATAEEMDKEIVRRWNAKVKPSDTVYIVGDVTLKKDVAGYVERLAGKKILILGNHDLYVKRERNTAAFERVVKMEEAFLDGRRTTLCHFPMLEWPGSRRAENDPSFGYLIYGHIHNNVKELYRPMFGFSNALNAGMDVNGLEPVTFEELMENNRVFRKAALEKCRKNGRKKGKKRSVLPT